MFGCGVVLLLREFVTETDVDFVSLTTPSIPDADEHIWVTSVVFSYDGSDLIPVGLVSEDFNSYSDGVGEVPQHVAGSHLTLSGSREISSSSYAASPSLVIPPGAGGVHIFFSGYAVTDFKMDVSAGSEGSYEVVTKLKDIVVESVTTRASIPCGEGMFCDSFVNGSPFDTIVITPSGDTFYVDDLSYSFDGTAVVPLGRLAATFDDVESGSGYRGNHIYEWGARHSDFSFDNSLSVAVDASGDFVFRTMFFPMSTFRFVVVSFSPTFSASYTFTNDGAVVSSGAVTGDDAAVCGGSDIVKPPSVPCSDLELSPGVEWTDNQGDNCVYYETAESCGDAGVDEAYRNTFIASEACCACNAGTAPDVYCVELTGTGADAVTVSSGDEIYIDDVVFTFDGTSVNPTDNPYKLDFNGLSSFTSTQFSESHFVHAIGPTRIVSSGVATRYDGSNSWTVSSASGAEFEFGLPIDEHRAIPLDVWHLRVTVASESVTAVTVAEHRRSSTEVVTQTLDVPCVTGEGSWYCSTFVVGSADKVRITGADEAAGNLHIDTIWFSFDEGGMELTDGVKMLNFDLVDGTTFESTDFVGQYINRLGDHTEVIGSDTGLNTQSWKIEPFTRKEMSFDFMPVSNFRVTIWSDTDIVVAIEGMRKDSVLLSETITLFESGLNSKYAHTWVGSGFDKLILTVPTVGTIFVDDVFYSFDGSIVIPQGRLTLPFESDFDHTTFDNLKYMVNSIGAIGVSSVVSDCYALFDVASGAVVTRRGWELPSDAEVGISFSFRSTRGIRIQFASLEQGGAPLRTISVTLRNKGVVVETASPSIANRCSAAESFYCYEFVTETDVDFVS